MKSLNFQKLVLYSFLLVWISDLIQYIGQPLMLNFSSTEINAGFKFISLFFLYKAINKSPLRDEIPKSAYFIFIAILVWNFVTFIRGGLNAKDYWDWRFLILSNFFALQVSFAMLVGVFFYRSTSLFSLILRKLFPYGFLLLPLVATKFVLVYSILMYPVCLFVLLSAYLKRKWFILIMIVALCSVVTGIEIRSNALRVGFPVLLTVGYYCRSIIKKWLIKFVTYCLFVLPLILLFLGVSGIYNIFNPNGGKAVASVASTGDSDLSADTRTGLYQEVFLSMKKHGSFLFGEGGSAKYESETFDNLNDGRGRYGSEVGFLNTLLYSGIVGVLFYLITLIMACHYAINQSSNFLCKMLAVFLAFRWVLFFIEDITFYDVNMYFLWITIGLCFSKSFRSLTDAQLTVFFRKITNKKSNYKIPVMSS